MKLEYWIVNALCFVVAPLSYTCYTMWKSIKKKDEKIDHLIDIIVGLSKNEINLK